MNQEQIAKLHAEAQHDLLAGAKAKNIDLQDVIALCQAAERTTSPVSQMKDATIREIFMAHGFTIKEGQTDLKPYVYAAARSILAAAAYQAQARYEWLANRVLACDYGDNDKPGQIGWRIRHNLLSTNGGRQPAFMYGKSIDDAIDAAMKENP